MSKILVNPEILRWARETAGLSIDVAAKKLTIGATKDLAPEQRLAQLEDGDEQPTRALLLKMAKQYRRSLLIFYLSDIPQTGDRGEDYRRLPDEFPVEENALVDALVRDVKVRQGIVRSAMEDDDDLVELQFIGSLSPDSDVKEISESIKDWIKFDLDIFRAQKKVSDAFTYVRSQAEAAGVFVLLIGDLGSHHTKITVEAFRGFALSDALAPFIIINDDDAKTAWTFTLFHELAHLWLGQTGISGNYADSQLEILCNNVAAQLLLPNNEVNEIDVHGDADLDSLIESIEQFADERNVSRTMVSYALLKLDIIDEALWNDLRRSFRQKWLDLKAVIRAKAKKRKGAPSYYQVRQHSVGTALIVFVSRMLASGSLSSTKAGKVLGVKPRNVYELTQRVA